MKRKPLSFLFVRGTGTGPTSLNQHAQIFSHKATKRNRDRTSIRRKAIDESKES